MVSSNGLVEYCCLSSAIQELTGITWLKRGDPVPGTATTARFQEDPENIANGCKADGTSMLDEWLDGAPRIEMKEDVVGLGHYGKTLTVLFTDQAIEPEDPDEPEDAYEHWEKRR